MSKHKTKREKSAIEERLSGFLIATVCFFSLMLIASVIAFFSDDPTGKSELWSFGAMLLSGAISGFLNARRTRGVVIPLLSSLLLLLTLFIIAAIAYGAPSLPSLINYAIYIGISGVFAFFGQRSPKNTRRR